MTLTFGLRRQAVSVATAVLVSLLFVIVAASARPSDAAALPRIVSINVCTDQLLLRLADPEQILGLGPYARDAMHSWQSDKAGRFRVLSGAAEDVLVLEPDAVVADRYTRRTTRELLKAKGLRVEEFDPVRSIDDVRAEIRRMGEIVGHPDRASAEIARLDLAIARAKAAAARRHFRVLALSRRGWVTGSDSLTDQLLAATGLSNAAGEMGYTNGGFASLETIIMVKPDLLLVESARDFAEDQGEAFLIHPALEKLYPPNRRLVVPDQLTVCGGPMLAEALDRLTAEIERVSR